MGQYHLIANLDKREYLHPHVFGDGLKMMEFGSSGDGTLTGLTILLSCSHERGGGDFHPGEPDEQGNLIRKHVMGRWAGDRIAIIGDYAETGDFPGFDAKDTPFNDGEEGDHAPWLDISEVVVQAMKREEWLREHLTRSWRSSASDHNDAVLDQDGIHAATKETTSGA